MIRGAAGAVIAIVVFGSSSLRAQGAPATQPPGVKRTVLQTNPLSVAGHDGVTALAELPPGGLAARHTHPGEEMGYVLEGEATLEVEGKPARVVKAGDVFFVPANTPHLARNNGTVPWKIVGNYILEAGKPLATPAPKP